MYWYLGKKVFGIQIILLAQAKAFMEKIYKSNITNLVVCLNRDRGYMWDAGNKHQAYLNRM